MKKAFFIVTALLFTLTLTGFVAAAERVKVKQISGEVAAVDAAAKSMTVKGKKAEVVIVIDEKTTVKTDKEKKSLADLKVGEKVTVRYAEIEGKNVGRTIEIKTAKAEQKGAAPARAAAPAKPAPKQVKPGY
ncbi:MAG: hypothetical protein IT388_11800 [Nitrospirales bacterium]|nr:hypothetical protein [Nitrospirales bacterium]